MHTTQLRSSQLYTTVTGHKLLTVWLHSESPLPELKLLLWVNNSHSHHFKILVTNATTTQLQPLWLLPNIKSP